MRRLVCIVILALAVAGIAWAQFEDLQKGEMEMEGKVTSVAPETKSFTILAERFGTKTSHNWTKLNPPRPKEIRTGDTTIFACYSGVTTLDAVQVGQKVNVIGKDTGKGKPLIARIVWIQAQTQTPPPPEAPSEPQPAPEIPPPPPSQ